MFKGCLYLRTQWYYYSGPLCKSNYGALNCFYLWYTGVLLAAPSRMMKCTSNIRGALFEIAKIKHATQT